MGCSGTRCGPSIYEGRPACAGGRSISGSGRGASRAAQIASTLADSLSSAASLQLQRLQNRRTADSSDGPGRVREGSGEREHAVARRRAETALERHAGSEAGGRKVKRRGAVLTEHAQDAQRMLEREAGVIGRSSQYVPFGADSASLLVTVHAAESTAHQVRRGPRRRNRHGRRLSSAWTTEATPRGRNQGAPG